MARGYALYRHFDKDGRLLYVGIALRVVNRTAQHLAMSHWHDDIARIDIERFANKPDALAAEMAAIGRERPLHNIVTPERKGIKIRSKETQARISELLSMLQERGYKVSRNACLGVVEHVWRDVSEGREPMSFYPVTRIKPVVNRLS